MGKEGVFKDCAQDKEKNNKPTLNQCKRDQK